MFTRVWTGILLIIFGISAIYISGVFYRKIEKRDYKDDRANEKIDRTFAGGVMAIGILFIFLGILFSLKNC